MKIKGELNRSIAKKIYRTYEQDGIFLVLDRDGGVGVECDGKGYITDDVEELYEYFDSMTINYMIRQAMDVPICPVCRRPIDPRLSFHPECKPENEIHNEDGWLNLGASVCLQAIKDYDSALDAYSDHPFDRHLRDEMLKLEMWIRSDEWELYSMGKVDGGKAVDQRNRLAKKRWKKRQRAKAERIVEKRFNSLIEEIAVLNERLEQYENSESEGQSKQK